MDIVKQIQEYQMDLAWDLDEGGLVAAFPCREGGVWGEGASVEEAVLHCMELNKLKEVT